VGFTQVADLQGGYDAWADAGLPTTRPETVA
jgi:rhodanese-related sulfurtransferase